MKKGILIGMATIASLWGLVAVATDPEVKTETITKEIRTNYPDVDPKVRTKEVDKPASKECLLYIEAVDDLLEAQKVLSKTRGRMQTIVQDARIVRGLENADIGELVELGKEIRLAGTQMDNAWVDIGSAANDINNYKDDCK